MRRARLGVDEGVDARDRRIPTRHTPVTLAALLALIVAGGCRDEAAQSEAGTYRVLVTAKEKPAKPSLALPSPGVWEEPVTDPELERGRLVWKGTCIQCHSIGLGGAPLIGNVGLWSPRIEQGLDVLVEHATKGFYGDVGEMPARGGNQALSDEEVRAAVRFMVSRAGTTL